MKSFRDSQDVAWTVFEVRRQVSAPGDWSYLPSGFSDGWLCFECSAAKKRLIRYPERWREFNDQELQKLLEQAAPAPRSNLRPGEDFGDSSTSPDLRPD